VSRLTVLKRLASIEKLSYVHPVLLAIAPVLYLYSRNLAEVTPSDLVLPLIAALGLGAVVLVLSLVIIALTWKILNAWFWTALGTRPKITIWDFKKAAIVTSIFLVLFFNYGDAWAITQLPWIFTAIVWIGLFIIAAFWVTFQIFPIRTRRNLGTLTSFLAVVGTILVMVPAIGIVVHEVKFGGRDIRTLQTEQVNGHDTVNGGSLPDIYYIVPDRYGSETALELNFGFDNSGFVDYLSSKGFYVASSSNANYARTFASLASSLNMEYINYLTEELGEDFGANYPMWELIQDNKVWRFLKSKGYKFINLGDQWDGTRVNEYADVNYNYFTLERFFSTEFSELVFSKTLAYPFCVRLLDIVEDPRVTHYKNVLYQFERLMEIPRIDGPTFTFAHLTIPHDPYVFDSNGNYKTLGEEQQKSFTDNYVDNITFLNSKLRTLIDELLEVSEVPPIIILQADEGPFSIVDPWLGEEATEAGLKVKMGILNAYYLPGVDYEVLHPSMTPVNSFRLVFDLYFGTTLGLLPDRCYAYDEGYPNKGRYKFIEVTDRLIEVAKE
jgi:hypothetical protein